MNLLLAAAAAAIYLLSAACAWREPGRRWFLRLAPAALALHGAALLQEIVDSGSLTIGVTEAVSIFAWQAALLLWIFCLAQPLAVLGLVLYPLAGLAALAAAAFPTSVTAIPLQDWKLQLHVALSLFSAGFLTLAAVQALSLALQDRLLHAHSAGGALSALPPLQTMERVLFQLITLGFFMLSLSLVTGLLFVDDLLAQHLAHKTVLTIVAWAVFGALLWGRWRSGWRGRTAIRWALSGYGVLILGYFGSKVILEQILGRHWT